MRKARKGTNVIYIPGNHDEAARQYCQLTFGDVQVEDEAIHETADGRKLLVIHGDQFDGIVRYARWLAILGDWAYSAALRINTTLQLGPPQARPALLVAVGVPQAQGQERRAVHRQLRARRGRAKRAGAASTAWSAATSTTPRSATIDGILYCNDGDWVESCTALVEDFEGRLRIVRWAEEVARRDAMLPRLRRPCAAGGGVAGLRIAIVSDAWRPQINGVVRTIETVAPAAARRGPRRRGVRARPLPHPALPDLSRDPAVAVSRRRGWRTC